MGLIIHYKKISFTSFLIVTFLLCRLVGFAQQPVANFRSTIASGCAPLTVNFQDISTGNPISWQWDLGNGTLSNQQNPNTTYFNAGIYTVSLKVSNANGSDSIAEIRYITVYDKPIVDFTASKVSGCFPLNITFTDLSVSGPATPGTLVGWNWDFGNGDTSSLENPNYTYTSSGNYSVTLKVTNSNGCTKVLTKIQYIQIPNGITANFNNSSVLNCKPPDTINFNNLSTGPSALSYQWDFGDGNTSTLQNPTHAYLTGGIYSVQLITKSSAGCVDTLLKKDSVVITNFKADFSGPDSICKGSTASFSNISIPNNTNSLWDFGDGTSSTLNTTTKVWNTSSTYQVKLVNNFGGCIDSVTKPVKVTLPSAAYFIATDSFNCKPPFTVQFKDLTPGSVTWAWNFGDGNTSTLQNPSHTYTTLGQFNVTLTITNGAGCSSTFTKNQYIKIISPIVSINGLPAGGCIPFTYNPTSASTDPKGIASYLWDFGDGNTSNQQTPTNIYTATGTYTLKLYVTTNDGCIDSAIAPASVKTGTAPTANFSAAPLVQCVGQNILFTDMSTSADGWTWDFGDGTSSTAQNPSHAYLVNGTFTVKLTATNNGCPATITKNNLVQALPPVAKFTPVFSCANKLQVVFTDNSVSPQTWAWDFGDGNTSNTPSPTHTYGALGNYSVTLTVTNAGCTNSKIIPIKLIDEHPDFIATGDSVCKNVAVGFSGTNITVANIASSNWDYGTGSSSGGPGVTGRWIYATSGTYTVMLTTTDIHGCKASIQKNNFMYVHGPTASFSASPLNGCKGLNVTFTDNSTTDGINPIKKWQWSYGDGIVQTLTTPPFSHIYNTSGSFFVKLNVTDLSGCFDSLILNTPVQITQPKAAFTSPDTAACTGSNVTFNNMSSGVSPTYTWSLGNNVISNQQNPTTTYAVDSNYSVKLVVTDANGCQDSLQKNNYIKSKTATAGFAIKDSVSSCSPFEVDFTNTSINNTGQLWNFGDGSTSSSKNPVHYYSSPGVYTATLFAISQGGCLDSIKRTIKLFSSNAVLTYTPLSGCSPAAVAFHLSTDGPVNYFWDFGDGNTLTSTDSNVVNNYQLQGDYIPKVILTDPTGCQLPITGNDTIHLTKSLVNFAATDSAACLGTSIIFTDSTTGNAMIIARHWDFGDGDTSALQNPVHLYAAPGSYIVKLIVYTANGCSDSLIKNNYIDIYGPVAKFGVSAFKGCKPFSVTFTDSSITDGVHPISNWQWNYGDGIIQNLSAGAFSHLYDTSGSFLSHLKITDTYGCSDSFNLNTPVFVTGPKAGFTSADTLICAGSNVFFDNTSSGDNLNYAWELGNGTTSNQLNPLIVYTIDSSYTIKLIVTDSIGCKDSLQLNNYIKVQTVKAAFTVNDSAGVCPPLNIIFTNNSINDSSYTWNFGDGTFSNAISPTHSYTIAGTYIVTLVATGHGGCIDSAKQTIHLYTSGGTLAYSPLSGCSQANISFHVTASGPVTYFWDFNDGDTVSSVLPDISHNYTTPGNYIPKVFIKDPTGCQVPVTGSDTIHIIKSIVNFVSADSTSCLGTVISFADSTAGNAAITSWHWSFGDADTSALQNPAHLYTISGAYNVQLIVYTANGCSDSLTKNSFIHIYGPVAKFGALPLNGCRPLNVSFTDSSVTDGIHPIANWQWNYGDGIIQNINSAPFSHLYDTSGYFLPQLKITDTYGCSDSFNLSSPVFITNPKAGFNSNDTIACIGSNVSLNNTSSGIGLTYAWSFSNGSTSNQTNPATSYVIDSNYSVKLVATDSIGCKDSIQLTNYIKVQTVKATFTVNDSISACPPLNITFTNTSVNDSSFIWDFGDGNTSNAINPTHSYNIAGTYIATLTAIGHGGCVDSAKQTIRLFASGGVLSYLPLSACSQISVNFHVAASGPVTYFWDFDDGDTTSSVLPDISHSYTSPGNYLPKVIIKDPTGCQIPVTGSDTIHVIKNSVNFISADSATCLKALTIFADSTTGVAPVVAWHWDFGDGDTSNIQNPSHSYTATGAYNVKLITYTVNGCSDSLAKNNFVHIYGPVAKFGAVPLNGCSALSVSFSDSSVTDGIHPLTNWQWDYGDGIVENLSGTPFNHVYNIAGSFLPQLKITDTYGCSDTFNLMQPVLVTHPKAGFNSTDTVTCAGKNVLFNNTSSGINLSYIWNLGNGTISNQLNPVTSYPVDSSYSVKLVVTDSIGCRDSLLLTNYIKTQTVKARFMVSDSVSSCLPLNVKFTNTSINDSSIIWDFGDGNFSTATNPSHSYTVAGIYTATLTVTGHGNCTDSAKQTIHLYSPGGALSYSPLSGCLQATVNFHVTASGPVTYFWDFKDGDTVSSMLPDVSHTYIKAGSYLPKVILKDITGCQVAVTGSDTIHLIKSSANFIAADPTVCLGAPSSFTDQSISNSTIITWQWNFGDGNPSLLQNPTHIYASPGVYTVELIIHTADGCIDTATKNNYITIHSIPKASVTGDTSSCIPGALTFNGTLLQPDTSTLAWQWHFGNGNTSNSQNPAIQQYKTAGNFPLQLIVSTINGCADTVSKTININPLPPTDAGANTSVCINNPAQLQANGADSYKWSPPDYLSCTSCSNPVAAPLNDIKYYVEGSNKFGCKTTDSVSITVNKKFLLTVKPVSDSLCVGQSVQLAAAGANNYIWSPSNGLSNIVINNPVAAPDTTTTYKVVGSDNAHCFSDSALVKITVFNYPTVNAGPDINVANGATAVITPQYSPDVYSWMWSPTDGLSCTACANPTAAPVNSTTYTITVANKAGCSSKDDIMLILPCQNTVFIPNTFSPNNDGRNDVFFPRGKDIFSIQSMLIFDRWGEVVFQRNNFKPNDPLQGWDGTFNGKQANADVYVYVIEIICNNSTISTFKGNITLIR